MRKKARVETRAEEDLSEDAEQEQDAEGTVVHRRQVGRENGKKKEVDEIGDHIRHAVNGRVLGEFFELRPDHAAGAIIYGSTYS